MPFLATIGLGILALLGVLLLAMSGHMVYDEHVMKKHGKKYSGKVVDEVKEDGFDDTGPLHAPAIEYQNDRNETRRLKSSVATGGRWKIGEAIDVYEFKGRVFVDHRMENLILKCGMAFFGILLVAIALSLGLHS